MNRWLFRTVAPLVLCQLACAARAYADEAQQPSTIVDETSGSDSPEPSPDATPQAVAEQSHTASPELTPPLPENYAVPPPPIGPLYPEPTDTGMSLGLDEDTPHIPARIGTRLRVLGTDLDALASHDSGGLGGGVMSMLAGGLSIALAQLIDQSAVRTFLYVFGTTSLVRGGLELTLSPDAESAALSYSHWPMRVPEEVMERLRFGESALDGLARDSRRLRMLDGAASIAAGAITVPFLLLGPHDKDSKFDTLDLFVVVGAGVSVLSGVVNLFSQSEAEKRNDAYKSLKSRLAKPAKTNAPPEISVSAAPGSVALWMRGHFSSL